MHRYVIARYIASYKFQEYCIQYVGLYATPKTLFVGNVQHKLKKKHTYFRKHTFVLLSQLRILTNTP